MRKIAPLIVIVALMFTMLGCAGGSGSSGSSIKNGTPEDAARTFIKALAEGNEEVLDELNKADKVVYPTHSIVSEYCPAFADFNVSDYDFKANDEKDRVFLYKKGTDERLFNIKVCKIGDKYYFRGF